MTIIVLTRVRNSWRIFLGVVVDCLCQTAIITTCASIERSAGRQTLNGSIRKPYQRSSMDRVSMLHSLPGYTTALIWLLFVLQALKCFPFWFQWYFTIHSSRSRYMNWRMNVELFGSVHKHYLAYHREYKCVCLNPRVWKKVKGREMGLTTQRNLLKLLNSITVFNI